MFWVRRLRKYRLLPDDDRRLAGEALFWLVLFWVALKVIPFNWIARRLGLVVCPPEDPSPGQLDPAVRRIGWAVRAAATALPGKGTCLVQALAGVRMLHRRRIPGTLYLGVAKQPDAAEPMAFHAWLRHDGAILTGNVGLRKFAVVAAFRIEEKGSKTRNPVAGSIASA